MSKGREKKEKKVRGMRERKGSRKGVRDRIRETGEKNNDEGEKEKSSIEE